MKPLSQSEYGELRSLYESVYAPKFESILDEFTDEDLDDLTEEYIEEQVNEFFQECVEEGLDIDIIEDVLPKYQSGEKKNPAGIDNLIRRIRGRVTAYSKNKDLYIAAGMEKEYKEFMAGMSKLFRDLQNLKPPSKEFTSGKFDPSTIPDPSPFGGNLE